MQSHVQFFEACARKQIASSSNESGFESLGEWQKEVWPKIEKEISQKLMLWKILLVVQEKNDDVFSKKTSWAESGAKKRNFGQEGLAENLLWVSAVNHSNVLRDCHTQNWKLTIENDFEKTFYVVSLHFIILVIYTFAPKVKRLN